MSTDTGPEDEGTEDRTIGGLPARTVMWLVAVVVAVACAVGVLALTGDEKSPAGNPSPTGSPTEPAPRSSVTGTRPPSTGPAPTSTASSTSVCGLPDGPQTPPPADIGPEAPWYSAVGADVVYPSVPKRYGPGKGTRATARTCFAHSPTGALFAAANFVAATQVPSTAAAQMRAQLVGPGVEAAIADVRANPPSGQGTTTISGYQWQGGDRDRARLSIAVTVATESGQNGYAAVTLDLLWRDGDWKVSTDASGVAGGGVQVLQSLDGFTPWLPSNSE